MTHRGSVETFSRGLVASLDRKSIKPSPAGCFSFTYQNKHHVMVLPLGHSRFKAPTNRFIRCWHILNQI